jgi:hypothetical protein
MRQPRGLVSEAGLRFGHQAGGQARARGDQRHGQVMLSHVAVGRLVEHAAGMPGARQIEQIQPALRGSRGEPGEPVIAGLRAAKRFVGVPRVSLAYAKRIETPGQPS